MRDFARLCDELFDDLLIQRWRQRDGERIVAVDLGESYEVKINAENTDPHAIELEVSDHVLQLRLPRVGGTGRHSCRFSQAIDSERVTANWRDGVLHISLPKRMPRRIPVE